jgi:hypothetical protein
VIRVVPLLALTVVALALLGWVLGWLRSTAARRPRRRERRPGRYQFDRRRDQAMRSFKGVGGPQERRDEIAAFLDEHRGVEAYVEPKTVISSKSVVLVDEAGEWRRFELKEDAYLRRLAAERGLPIFDAAITGYPPRMRRAPAG